MAKSIKVKPKKRGRPATGRDPFVGVRLPTKLIAEVQRWAAQNGSVTRSAAIRRLVEHGLAVARPSRPHGKKAAAKASNLAGREIDQMTDKSAPRKERERRKRTLLKGPTEFHDIRRDHPKAKR